MRLIRNFPRCLRSNSMRRWVLGKGVKIDAVKVKRSFFFASASKTQTPTCPLLHCRPKLLNVGIPNARQTPFYPRDRHWWILNSSILSSSSRKQKDPYTAVLDFMYFYVHALFFFTYTVRNTCMSKYTGTRHTYRTNKHHNTTQQLTV